MLHIKKSCLGLGLVIFVTCGAEQNFMATSSTEQRYEFNENLKAVTKLLEKRKSDDHIDGFLKSWVLFGFLLNLWKITSLLENR